MYETAAFTNMASDIAILALPFPVICNLHMLNKNKTIVLAIFMTGAIVIVASIGRTVAYFSYRNLADYNFSADYYTLIIWTSLEPTLGVVGACLPTIRPLFQGFSPESIINSIRSVISLHSRRGSRSNINSATGTHKAANSDGSESSKGFARLDDDVEPAVEEAEPSGGQIGRSTRESEGAFGKAGMGNSTMVSIELDERMRLDDVEGGEGRIRAMTTYGVLADQKV